MDSRQLQLASALQRYSALQRRAESQRDTASVLTRTLAELQTALEEVRVAQERLIENRNRTEELEEQLRQQANRYWRLFDELPEAYVVTRPDSVIVEANKAAADLLNVSQRFLVGKALSVFVCENRDAFLQASTRAAESGVADELVLQVRPRERAPLAVRARVHGDATELRWRLLSHHNRDSVAD